MSKINKGEYCIYDVECEERYSWHKTTYGNPDVRLLEGWVARLRDNRNGNIVFFTIKPTVEDALSELRNFAEYQQDEWRKLLDKINGNN